MINQTPINLLKKGERVNHFLLVKRCELKLTKTNKEYLSLDLCDKSITLSANMWDNIEHLKLLLKTGIVIKVSGVIEEWLGSYQIKVEEAKLALDSDKVMPHDFLAHSDRDPVEMKTEFFSRIDKISHPKLKLLIQNIFNEEMFEKFSISPAGKTWHHSYIGGLLEHTLEIIRICDLMADIHPELNRDILICGAILHDIGKTEEISPEPGFEYTNKGKLLGHIVMAVLLVEEEISKIKDFPEDFKECLLHLILSHQGKLEYASPVVPKTIEAIALYQADELSAKTNAYKNTLRNETKTESKWTRFIHLANTDLYNHGLSADEEKESIKSLFD